MNVTFDTGAMNHTEVRALIALLSALIPGTQTTAGIQTAVVSVEVPPSASESTPAQETQRRKRAPKTQPESQVQTPASATSADELRNLLNSYIAKHSMEDAIAKLKNYGCNRVTEALSLEAAKLNALVKELQ